MKPMSMEQARKAWTTNPNRMVAFAPGTHESSGKHPDRWLLADSGDILGTGFCIEDCVAMRDSIKRRST